MELFAYQSVSYESFHGITFTSTPSKFMISVSFPNKSTLLLHNFKCTERAFNEEVNVRSFFSVINNRINIVFFLKNKIFTKTKREICSYIA